MNSLLDKYILPLPVRFITSGLVILLTMGLLVPLVLFRNNTPVILLVNSYLNVMSVAVASIVLRYAQKTEAHERQMAEENHKRVGELYGLMSEFASHSVQSPSPDGAAMALERDGEIWVRDVRGIRNITHDAADDTGALWSPDGRWLAFRSNRGGEWSFWVASVSSGKLAHLTAIPGRERPAGWDANANLQVDLGGSLLVVKREEIERKLK